MDNILEVATQAIDKAIASLQGNEEIKKELESVKDSQKQLSDDIAIAKKESSDKDVAIASLTDKVEDLESIKFVSECKAEVVKKNSEIATAALEVEKESNRRKTVLKENEIDNEKVISIALAFKTGEEFDEFLEATKSVIATASIKELDRANASIIKEQKEHNTGGEMQISQKDLVSSVTGLFKKTMV